ncbi:LysR family transcriptional regulator [Sphingomonas sp. MMSM24]|uniref:LysR family transcriptional regulator n=2 Tax=Sphingomonas lycopersici TaxID=2951807 RepID=A0AA42CPI8_9SPHN|nr:LysR family transcriptional regulator [Sphingomonas lycopersici]
MNNLQPSDLSLLPILEALIEERHVSRAAIRLNRSQPAVSHALARLRDLFNDPLLVRGKGGLQPTARALELVEPLAEALALIRSIIDQSRFDVAHCNRHFRLSMSDYGATILLPTLVADSGDRDQPFRYDGAQRSEMIAISGGHPVDD